MEERPEQRKSTKKNAMNLLSRAVDVVVVVVSDDAVVVVVVVAFKIEDTSERWLKIQ